MAHSETLALNKKFKFFYLGHFYGFLYKPLAIKTVDVINNKAPRVRIAPTISSLNGEEEKPAAAIGSDFPAPNIADNVIANQTRYIPAMLA